MVPGQPRPASQYQMSLGRVQTWVLSTLAVSTILHIAAAMVLAAVTYVDERSSQIGLLVISGAFGFIAAGAGLLIHRKPLLHPFLLIGLIPPAVGAFFVF